MKSVLFIAIMLLPFIRLHAEVKLTHPAGGEEFVIGSDTLISWEGIQPGDTVSIDYSTDGGKNWINITDTATGLSYIWKVPWSKSQNCLLKISYKKRFLEPTIIWEKSYGDSTRNYASSMKMTSDSNYIIAGSVLEKTSSLRKPFVLKINSCGVKQWNKSYGDVSISTYGAKSIYSTQNKGSIFAGVYRSNYYVVKIDSIGTVEWEKISSDYANKIIQTSDGNYIVAGYTRSRDGDISVNYGAEDFWILKLDDKGQLIWEKSYGGSRYDAASTVHETIDGNYLVGGFTWSDDGDVDSYKGLQDAWLIKIDRDGNLIWNKTYGGYDRDVINDIVTLNNGNCVLLASTRSNDGDVSNNKGMYDYWVIKINSAGNIIWEKTFGGSANELARSIHSTSDEGLIIVGSSTSHDGDVRKKYYHSVDYWLIKLDREGILEWEISLGGSLTEYPNTVIPSGKNEYLVCGNSVSDDGDVSNCKNPGLNETWIVKVGFEKEGADTSGIFSILEPEIEAADLDLGSHCMGGFIDSLITAYINNSGDYRIRIDSIFIDGKDKQYFEINKKLPFYLEPGETGDIHLTFLPDIERSYNSKIVIYTQSDTLLKEIRADAINPKPHFFINEMDFGLICYNEQIDSVDISILKNNEYYDFEITDIYLAKGENSSFDIYSGGEKGTLKSKATIVMDISFIPNDPGEFRDSLFIEYECMEEPYVIELTGEAMKPEFEIAEKKIDLGFVLPGEIKDSLLIDMIINTGEYPLNLISISRPNVPFEIIEGGAPIIIGQGNSHNMKLSFAPVKSGDFRDSIIIEYDCMDEPVVLYLEGTTIEQGLNLATNEIDFLTICHNSQKDSSVFILENTGSSAVDVYGISLAEGVRFQILSGSDPGSIQPGAMHMVSVRFMPGEEGVFRDSIIIEYEGKDSPQVVHLNGSAVKPYPEIITADYDFGSICVNSSDTMNIEFLKNSGTVPIDIQEINIAGNGSFELLTEVPDSLLPGEILSFKIRFFPESPGTFSSNFEIEYQCMDEPIILTLSGTGIKHDIEIAQTVDFGSILIGESVKFRSAIIINNGSLQVDFSNLVNPRQPFVNHSNIPRSLAAGDTLFFDIEFSPISAGSFNDSLIIYYNCMDKPAVIYLEGIGSDEFISAELEFPELNGIIGEKLDIPLYAKLSLDKEIHVDFVVQAAIPFDAFLPDMAIDRYDDRFQYLTLSGSAILNSEKQAITEVPGKVLFGSENNNPIKIISYNWKDNDIPTTTSNGTLHLNLDSLCVPDLRRVGRFTPLEVSVNPNPVGDGLELTIKSEPDIRLMISLYDTQGSLILTEEILSSGINQKTLDTKTISAGIYRLIVQSPWETKSKSVGIVK
ncbi:MAG: choice-of-anchor D domain-containing protein [Candidatus Kapaibacterium sp.]